MTTCASATLLAFAFISGMFPAAALSTAWTNDNRVHVDGGLISGQLQSDSQVRVFKGIPYAAPPVGNLRWKPPQAVTPWKGLRDAEKFGPSCSQTRLNPGSLIYVLVPDEQQPISEDCLYLNVWTAARSPRERRPVLLWIHPSAGILGGAAKPIYDGETLAKKGAIVVTINHRLGIFGFFAHPQLSKESAHRSSGNYALLDMIAAIKWVRRNISAFGGDPDRITLWGESAGGMSVAALTTSPLVKGDIRRAIVEDGLQLSYVNLAQEERRGAAFAQSIGAASIDDLRKMPAERLLAAISAFGAQGNDIFRSPKLDHWVLTRDLLSAERQGLQRGIDILTGSTSDFGAVMGAVRATPFVKGSQKIYGALAERFFSLYPAASDTEAANSMARSITEGSAWAHKTWAVAHTQQGGRAYLYFFTHAPPLPPDAREGAFGGPLLERLGAYHTGEVPYTFDSLKQLDFPWTDYDHRLADMITFYWVNFAATGDPNGPGLPPWPAYGDRAEPLMELGDQVRPIPPVLSPVRNQFWADHNARNGTLDHDPGAH